jgi:hypothetical protein
VLAGQIVNNQITTSVSSDGYISLFNAGGTIDAILDVVGYYSANGSSYIPQDAARILDTRNTTKVPAGGTVDVPVSTTDGKTITAATVQITVTNQTVNAFLSAYPTGSTMQGASNVNYYAGQNITRMATSAVGSVSADGSTGKITIRNGGSTPTDVIVDLIGVYTTDRSHGVYMPISPERIFDSRDGTGTSVGRLATQVPRAVTLSQQGFAQLGYSATRAADVNMILVGASAPTYLTASTSVTFSPTQTYVTYNAWNPASNRGTVKTTGYFNIFNAIGTSDAVVDQFGYYY